MNSSTATILTKLTDVCDWLVAIGASEALVEELLADVYDVYGIRYQEACAY